MRREEDNFRRVIENMRIDDSPRAEHRQQLRAEMLAEAARRDSSSSRIATLLIHGRQMMSRPVPRYAAACLSIGMIACALFFIYGGHAPIALADLIQPILEAKTARFKMTAKFDDQPRQTFTAMVLEPNRFRQELSNGSINIADWNKGKMVGLDPKTKTATIFNLSNVPEDRAPQNFFGQLKAQLLEARDAPDVKRESLGEKLIDGRTAIGYRLTAPAQVTTIWGDPTSGLPISIKATANLVPKMETTMTDFEFNLELDESLFSVEPPADFKVHELNVDASLPAEKDLIEMLRQYSDLTDGAFPEGFNSKAITDLFVKLGVTKDEPPSEEQSRQLMELSVKLGRGFQFAMKLPPAADAHYAGKTVKRDAPNAPIFWYKPKGQQKYRVISADLSVQEKDAAPQDTAALRVSPDAP